MTLACIGAEVLCVLLTLCASHGSAGASAEPQGSIHVDVECWKHGYSSTKVMGCEAAGCHTGKLRLLLVSACYNEEWQKLRLAQGGVDSCRFCYEVSAVGPLHRR